MSQLNNCIYFFTYLFFWNLKSDRIFYRAFFHFFLFLVWFVKIFQSISVSFVQFIKLKSKRKQEKETNKKITNIKNRIGENISLGYIFTIKQQKMITKRRWSPFCLSLWKKGCTFVFLDTWNFYIFILFSFFLFYFLFHNTVVMMTIKISIENWLTKK